MSWLSSICKKITKIQPGKVIVNAAKAVAGSIPVVGGLISKAETTVAQVQDIAGSAAQTVQNVNQAAKDTSKISTYILIGVAAVVIIVIIMMVRKR